MRPLRIGLLTTWDARRPRAASGTTYYMARALEAAGCEVVHVRPRSVRETLGRSRSGLARFLGIRSEPRIHGVPTARDLGRLVVRRAPSDLDVFLAPMGSPLVAFLETHVPIVYTSDVTFDLLRDYYPEYAHLSARYLAEAEEIERRAIRNARLLTYPSRWAAESAIQHYGASPDRVHVVSWGANLEDPPAREQLDAAKPLDQCRLLFLGRDWERKGGPLAYEAVRILRACGIPARLIVVGCRPAGIRDAGAVEVVGPLHKEDGADRAYLTRLMLGASFLLQPARAEALGLVYCEASAHGVPSIATDTGGVAAVVTHGRNGFLLPPGAGASEYAELISRVFADRAGYLDLVRSTRAEFDTRLNWNAWARALKPLLASLPPPPG